jgi:hypothetical protein
VTGRIDQGPLLVLFQQYAPAGVSQKYLLALAFRESSLDPTQVNPKSGATGLFQITQTVLRDYNAHHDTAHTLPELTNPELATAVATWHIARIVKLLAKHPSTRTDFTSRRFVELLTFGWNAGQNGVEKLVGILEEHGIPTERITIDAIREAAVATGKGPYLSDPNRVAWAKSVAALFLGDRQRTLLASAAGVSSGAPAAAAVGLAALGLAAATALRTPSKKDDDRGS